MLFVAQTTDDTRLAEMRAKLKAVCDTRKQPPSSIWVMYARKSAYVFGITERGIPNAVEKRLIGSMIGWRVYINIKWLCQISQLFLYWGPLVISERRTVD